MSKTKKFYGVAGTNGYGVYDEWGAVMRARLYIKEITAQGFDNYEDAKEFAYDQFVLLQYGAKEFYQIDEITKLNWFYHKKVKENKSRNTAKPGHSFFERTRQEAIQSQKKVQICASVMAAPQPIQTPMVSERTQPVLTPVRQMVKPFTIDVPKQEKPKMVKPFTINVPKQEKNKMVKPFTIDVSKPDETKMVKPFTIGI